MDRQHEALMGPDQPLQRSLQLREFLPQPALGQVGQHLGVLLSPGHGFQHGPPRYPQHISGHRGQLDVGPFQHFLNSVGLPAALLHQAPPVAGQFPQLPLGPVRDETGLQKAVAQQVGNPFGILHVGLAPRHGLHVAGVDHHHGELLLQEIVDRFPVDPGALHRHLGHFVP